MRKVWTILLLGALSLPTSARADRDAGSAPAKEERQRLSEELEELERQTQLAAEKARKTAERMAEQAGQGIEQARRELREALPTIRTQVEKLGQSIDQLEDAFSSESSRRLRGTVQSVTARQLVLEDTSGHAQRFRTDDRTYVVRGEEEVGRELLKPGARVRVTFVVRKDERTAREVELLEP